MTILYTNDVVGETVAGVNVDNENTTTGKCTTTISNNWWGTDPAFQYTVEANGEENETGCYIVGGGTHWARRSNTDINLIIVVDFVVPLDEAQREFPKFDMFKTG